MQINVSQLLRASVGTTQEYEISEAVDVLGDGNIRPVEGKIKLLRTNRSILVEATLHTGVELSCSRCMGMFVSPLTLNIEEEFIPTIDVVNGYKLPPPEEPGTFTIDEHHVIDLTEAILQYAWMTVPMKPVCREDCAGLCQQCGQNLNLEKCGCPADMIDPRWSRLTELR